MTLHSSKTTRAACGLTFATLVLAVPATLAMDDDKDEYGNRARARIGFVKTDDVDHQSLEVVIKNADVTVSIDGEVVPDGQVIREDGTIVIRDADGNEIRTIRIADRPGHFMDFSFGDGENRAWVAGDGEAVAEPSVMLGIQIGALGPALEHHLRLDPGSATMILGLYEGLPAHTAGLGEHDIITHIDGTQADPASLRAALAEREPGDVARVKVIQRGKPLQVEVELLAYDREAMAEAKLIGSGHRVATLFGGDAAIAFDTEGEGGWFGRVPHLNHIFVDDSHRVFEFAPGVSQFHESDDFFTDGSDDGELDGRLNRLDRRLADLQEVLDALIKEAKRQQEDQ